MHGTIARKPGDGFCPNFQRMITNILHIYYKCLAEFEIVVQNIFLFFNPFGFRFSPYYLHFLITLQPLDRFCSNFEIWIITVLIIYSQFLIDLEIGVLDIFDIFEPLWTTINMYFRLFSNIA